MVRVREDDLRIVGREIAWLERLDGRLRSHRHERGRLHIAMRKVEHATPRLRLGVAGHNLKLTYYFLLQNTADYTINAPRA